MNIMIIIIKRKWYKPKAWKSTKITCIVKYSRLSLVIIHSFKVKHAFTHDVQTIQQLRNLSCIL